MQKLAKVFFWGMIVSFLGSLPLGTMNVTSTHIAVQQGIRPAFIYACGSMLVEIIIVRLALIGMNWLGARQKLFRILEMFTLTLIIFLAIASLVAAYRMTDFTNSLPIRISWPFWTGAFLSLTNPLHLPFWLGWSTVLINKNILQTKQKQYNFYVVGIGLGTMMGFSLFILAGSYFINAITQHNLIINLSI
ncbi:MAG TPA: LysE family transporter, partial [Puia sp.]|nr:LysE family transporter [Puia sp.]